MADEHENRGPAQARDVPLLHVERLGKVDYMQTWQAMQRFTAERDDCAADQLWLLQHPPVYTLGLAGKTEHLLRSVDIPLVRADRGGQVTYHGPGQLIAYLLVDLRRRNLGVREMVNRMEQAVIDLLAAQDIEANRRKGAPGVYIGDAKIAALGLRVKNACTYHGIALNVNMDLTPFLAINPCGFAGMAVTQLADFVPGCSLEGTADQLEKTLQECLR